MWVTAAPDDAAPSPKVQAYAWGAAPPVAEALKETVSGTVPLKGEAAAVQESAAADVRPRQVRLTFTLVLAAGCLAAGMLIGHAIAAADIRAARAEADTTRTEMDRLAEAHDTLQERNWILYEEATAAQAEVAANAPDLPPGTFGDGVYVVGTDIEAGTYRGEVVGEWGYWGRLRDTSGMISGINANAVVRGPFELEVLPADAAIELRGVTLTRAGE